MEYIVKTGENLITIAKNFNTSLAKIIEINNITNPNTIKVGQKIIVPDPENKIITFPQLTSDNINIKIQDFLNFLEGKKLKRSVSSLAKDSISLIFNNCLKFLVFLPN